MYDFLDRFINVVLPRSRDFRGLKTSFVDDKGNLSIGIAEHHKVVDGDYVRKEEISQIVADSVVTGVSALMEGMDPVAHHKDEEPMFHAQSIVEKNVADKKKSDGMANIVMGIILIAQCAFFAYMFLM